MNEKLLKYLLEKGLLTPENAAAVREKQLKQHCSLRTLALTVNYKCSYDEFQEMVTSIAADEKLSSVYAASMNYNAEKDLASGTITIIRYLLDSELVAYHKPQISAPETGKANIFKESDD